MKTKILLSAIILTVVSAFVLNISDSATASSNLDKAGCEFYINLSGPGYTDTGASVWIRNAYTSQDQYASYHSPGVYVVNCPEPGLYHVFVCSGTPSYGSLSNVTIGKEGGSCNVSLTSGFCPFLD